MKFKELFVESLDKSTTTLNEITMDRMKIIQMQAKGSKIPKAKLKKLEAELKKVPLNEDTIENMEAIGDEYGFYLSASFFKGDWHSGVLVQVAKDVTAATQFKYDTIIISDDM